MAEDVMSKSILFQALHSHGAFAAFTAMTLLSLSGCVGGADAEPDDGEENASHEESPLSGLTTTHTGEGTYYAKTSNGGHCSYGAVQSTLFGAMNYTDYANSEACGMCTEITGPNGTVKVQIVDECPECKPGDIDLSEAAFLKLAPLVKGRIPISWKYVPCDVAPGGIVYHYKDGTHQWWNAVQIRNAKRGISKLEAKKNGQFITLQRESYNYFIASSGLGPGPFEFRITDVAGNVITESGVAFTPNGDVASPGQKQLP
jgi:expansin